MAKEMTTRDEIQGLLQRLPHKIQVSYALSCAKDVLHLAKDKDRAVVQRCIDVVELWLRDKATAQDCHDAAQDCHDAAYAAANAAYAAYAAANAAAYAAYAAYATHAANAAYAAAYAAYAAANAVNAAYAATYAVSAVSAAYAAANTANSAVSAAYAAYAAGDYDNAIKKYLSRLKTMIKELTELDRIVYGVTDLEDV